jgi:Zn-dependent peptidase ImmA (M78 family)/DNA-binding XRE family transcriptional regulator
MKGKSLQYCVENINPEQVTAARELRGMTKKDLADRIGKSPSAITRIEKGELRPELDTLFSLSQVLQVDHSFFALPRSSTHYTDLVDCHFRSKRSTSLALKRMAKQQGERLFRLVSHFEKHGVSFLEEQVSQLTTSIQSPVDIEELAYQVRSTWGLGIGPIPDLMSLFESKGIRIFLLPEESGNVDAFSAWIHTTPCIFLYSGKPASRINFDLAHELGHLIFHQDTETGDNKTEREANRFASAFLLPKKTFSTECPRRWSLQAYLALKKRWKVSIAAMLYRAKELRIISESSYRRSCIAMSPHRKEEPGEFTHSRPELLSQIVELVQDEVSLANIASELGYGSKQELRTVFLKQGVTETLLEKIDQQNDTAPSNLVYLRNGSK